jgi:hypothetical protein
MYTDHKQVFALAAKIAKELRTKNPKLTVPESTKLAWKDPRIEAARKEVAAHKSKQPKSAVVKRSTPRPSGVKRRSTTGTRKVTVSKK